MRLGYGSSLLRDRSLTMTNGDVDTMADRLLAGGAAMAIAGSSSAGIYRALYTAHMGC